MDEFDKNKPVDFTSLPGMNQSPVGPSFRDAGPQAPQNTKKAALKLTLSVVGAVIGFFLIRVLL